MLIKTNSDGFSHPLSSEITSQRVYAARRDLIKLMASGVAGAALASWASREAHA
ncbi:MAG: protein-methionine-sulfoxide reductase catalytic subunit MsrP, partial [Rhodoferax sp.]|nr:protein-methionine-sulfoxide reductase catalytic subunit MsrP [Rhodoferax sp.]